MKRLKRRRASGALLVTLAAVAAVAVGTAGLTRLSADEPARPSTNPREETPSPSFLSVPGEEASSALFSVVVREETPSSEPDEESMEPPALDDWRLILVNAQNLLPSDFSVELADTRFGYQVDKRIVEPLYAMADAAAADGVALMPCSTYRTRERSAFLYERQIESRVAAGMPRGQAAVEAAKWVAPPGQSEHHTGLALDIVTPSYQSLDHGFADTAAGKWLAENAHRFGFVVRYPIDKQEVTGITYEPWHMRYVGTGHAAAMREKGLCLEEYLQLLSEGENEE